jgi:hypothetical protein
MRVDITSDFFAPCGPGGYLWKPIPGLSTKLSFYICGGKLDDLRTTCCDVEVQGFFGRSIEIESSSIAKQYPCLDHRNGHDFYVFR